MITGQSELMKTGQPSLTLTLTLEGLPWSTDKDGVILCLLAVEITTVTGKRLVEYYRELTDQYGAPYYRRVERPCSREQQEAFKGPSPEALGIDSLTADPIR